MLDAELLDGSLGCAELSEDSLNDDALDEDSLDDELLGEEGSLDDDTELSGGSTVILLAALLEDRLADELSGAGVLLEELGRVLLNELLDKLLDELDCSTTASLELEKLEDRLAMGALLTGGKLLPPPPPPPQATRLEKAKASAKHVVFLYIVV